MDLKTAALDLIFPQLCLGCGEEGTLLCPACEAKLTGSPQRICPICKSVDQAKNCPGSPLDNLWTLAHYQEYLAAELIQKVKYNYLVGLAEAGWKKRLENFWNNQQIAISNKAIIVPVPLHRQRMLERGFNQSELIARSLGNISGLSVKSSLLIRAKATKPQVGLSGEDRLSNLAGIFDINYRALSDCWKSEILLIDDVYTTGSTMAECAKTLRLAGFKRVSGLVLAVD